MDRRVFADERGIVLTVALFVIVLLMGLSGAGLQFAGLNLKSTSHLKTGTTTLHVADAAIQHALAEIPLGHVFTYTTETTLLNSVSFGDGYSYTVKAINDPASPGGDTRAILTATALGPNGARKVIVAYIKRGNYGLGATSLPGSLAGNTETSFSGDSFTINGNYRLNKVPAVPGIMVTDPALVTEIVNTTTSDGGLTTEQMDNVVGPGAANSAGTSVRSSAPLEKTVLQYASDYLKLMVDEPLPGGTYGGNDKWGTVGQSKITHVTGDVRIAGTIEGHGVLILDGSLEVTGNFTFNGLVITRGDGYVRATGNARIYGAVLIAESTVQDAGSELDIRGNVNIQFDSCALKPADDWVSLPQLPALLAWSESFAN